MRIARPMSLIFVIVLALALPHGASDVVFAQTECVHPLDSVAVEGTWNGNCLSRNREDAYARYYAFSILRQSDVSITLESETDPYVFLLSGTGADAEYLTENDDIDTGGRNFNSRIAITLEPGDYTIEATTYEQPATGDFTLTVRGVGSLDDRATLVALYNATGGNNWRQSDSWLTDAPLGEWYGVVTDDNGRVIRLELDSNRLSGQIPTDLASLDNLEVLRLVGNELTGAIPSELSTLNDLRTLDLFANQLTGTIPPALGNLATLTTLNLAYNQLTGTIPTELGGLENLQWLWLHENQLTGAIPPEIGNLVNLQYLVLRNNRLTGAIPVQVGNLSNLKSLSLSINQISGTIPPELGKLSNLEQLRLYENRLTGQIPTELGDLENLTQLHLSGNNLTSEIPAQLGKLIKLEFIF